MVYQKGSVPMEGLTTSRRDFALHKIVPVKLHQPDQFVPSQETMDLATTYKQDYNPYPVCQVGPIKPRDSKYPRGNKMECLPTYKADYLPWKQCKREPIRPVYKYQPASTRFDNRTTHQDDYSVKGHVTTMSCKPPAIPKLYDIPLEDLTNYKMNYVAHPVEKRFVHEAEKFRPCEIPFESLTTHKESYRGLLGEPAKSLKPLAKGPGLETPFSSTTEFRDKYQAWPTPQMFSRSPVTYVPPEEKMDLLTTVKAHYTYPKGTPAQSCRPVPTIKKGVRFECSTTTKNDYKQWTSTLTKPIRPIPNLSIPADPLDFRTTTQINYVPHPPVGTKSFKPPCTGPRENIPVDGQTTYSISFTPKEMDRCPASYMEPPGYVFEEVDDLGHRFYRPASRQNRGLSIGDAQNSNLKELAVST